MSFKGDFIDGQFVMATSFDEEWSVYCPADLSDQVLELGAKLDHVDRAVQSAADAYLGWARLKDEERFSYLLRLKEIFQAHAPEWAEVISRETGKPLWDAKSEVNAMINKVDITINHSMKLVAEDRIAGALPGVNGVIRHKPRGVMAVIGPFNFPGHLPNGHIIPALACGNTVVFKPSDKTPLTGQFMAELYMKAGFPMGVFNLVHGLGETGKRLAGHDKVDGVLFTGSYEVGLKIKQETISHFWKILALEMGGKNATIVWKDADLEKAIYESLIGAFLTTGQRCSCTSRLILHEDIKDRFVDRFYAAAKKLKIGHWKDDVFMGPLIDGSSVEKYLRFQEIAKREGAEPLMRGKKLDLPYDGHYVTPSICVVPQFDERSVYQKSEIFGPNVAIYSVRDFDEALRINNSTGFGLAMALFTKDESLYRKSLLEAKVGVLNWNRTTNGASSRLPFGGMGKSGNDRPSAHFAVQYCTVPVASLEDHIGFDSAKVLPGMNYS